MTDVLREENLRSSRRRCKSTNEVIKLVRTNCFYIPVRPLRIEPSAEAGKIVHDTEILAIRPEAISVRQHTTS